MSIHALVPSRTRHQHLPPSEQEDAIVFLRNATWADYERLVEIRGEKGAPRLTFAEGILEIMSPSFSHERILSTIGRLLDVWLVERRVDATPVGQWTLKAAATKKGLEPDECYVLGRYTEQPTKPDLAIEVIWTSGGIDKLSIYRDLGVREVWFWKDDALELFELRAGQYAQISESGLLQGLDLPQLLSFIAIEPTTEAIRAYRAALLAK